MLNKGERVEYTGNICPMHKSKRGVIESIDRRGGWLNVRFDGEADTVACANISLTLLTDR